MKQCSRCLETKEDSEFYQHKTNLDGLTGKCKKCTKQYTKEWYYRNMKSLAFRRKQCENSRKQRLRKNGIISNTSS